MRTELPSAHPATIIDPPEKQLCDPDLIEQVQAEEEQMAEAPALTFDQARNYAIAAVCGLGETLLKDGQQLMTYAGQLNVRSKDGKANIWYTLTNLRKFADGNRSASDAVRESIIPLLQYDQERRAAKRGKASKKARAEKTLRDVSNGKDNVVRLRAS